MFYCYRRNSNIVNREKCHRMSFTMLMPIFPYQTLQNQVLLMAYHTHCYHHHHHHRHHHTATTLLSPRSIFPVLEWLCGFKTAINIYAQSAYFIRQSGKAALGSGSTVRHHAISSNSHPIGNMVWIASSLFDLLTLNLKSFH